MGEHAVLVYCYLYVSPPSCIHCPVTRVVAALHRIADIYVTEVCSRIYALCLSLTR